MKRLLITSCLAACLAGCESINQALDTRPPTISLSAQTPAQVAGRVQTRDTTFDSVATLNGPKSQRPVGTQFSYHTEEYFLRSFVSKSLKRATGHQLYVTFHYNGDWRFYRAAQTTGGRSLEFTSIGRDVGYCGYGNGRCDLREDVGVMIPEDAFQKARNDGMQVRITSQYSNISSTFYLPRSMFEGQAMAVDRYLGREATAAPPRPVSSDSEPMSDEDVAEYLRLIGGE